MIILLSFFLLPKEVSATVFTLEEYSEFINTYTNFSYVGFPELILDYASEVNENTIEIKGTTTSYDVIINEEYLGLFDGRYLTFEVNPTDSSVGIFATFLIDSYGQLLGFEQYEFFFYIEGLASVFYDTHDEDYDIPDLFIFEGVEMYSTDTEGYLKFDFGERPKEPEKKEEKEVDAKEVDVKEDDVIDVNPPTSVNTYYISLSLSGFVLCICLRRINKYKYL